jgi:hypothetical protein
MQRLRPLPAIAAGALALWLALPSYVNYDTAWSLVWGGELARGTGPHLDALAAPTPHPLGTLVGVLLAPLGAGAGDAAAWLALSSLAAVAWLAWALDRAWFGRAAGWVAAALALTSIPLLTTAARAYLDLPYLALVLAALLVETRRPRAGAPVLALLAVAGLWRPEAWLFSAAYWAWAARGCPRAEAARLAALAAAAPAAWLLGDLVLAGDPLHSLSWTRERAAVLGRTRGPGALRTALPDKLAQAVTTPVLIAGTAGLGLLLLRRPRSGGLAAAALGVSLATAAGLTTAGMPVVERYLLLPVVVLIALAAGAAAEALGSLETLMGQARTGEDRRDRGFGGGARMRTDRRSALAGAAACTAALALLAASLPGRLGAALDTHDRLAAQAALRADLRALADGGALPARCSRVAVSNHKLIPLLALWTGRRPASFVAGAAAPTRGAFVDPATGAAERTLLFASSDPPEAAPVPPPGAAEIARDRSWRVQARC